MGPLFNLLEKIEGKLGHSPHPAIVPLPLGAWTVSAIADLLGLVTRHRSYEDTARVSMGIGLTGAAGAVVAGLHDYSYIPRERPTHAIATTHALRMVTAAALFTTSFILRERSHQAGHGPGWIARALALGGWGIMLSAAQLGGVLVEEHGEGVKPVIREQAREEQARKEALEQESPTPVREPRPSGQNV
jgi:uncharacterized membrane protein